MVDRVNWTEQVVAIGGPTPLAGVVTMPEKAEADTPMVVLLNSGMMHRVGTCNLSVKIARALASESIPAARIDFSGIGDSRARNFNGSHEEREVAEVVEMIDALSADFGISTFYLGGLCSGADAALAVAEVESRVKGIVQIDPYCFRTRKWYLYNVCRKLTDSRAWRRMLKRLLGRRVWFDRLPEEYLESVDSDVPRHRFGREKLGEAYRAIVARKTRLLVIMTEGQKSCYNYLGQFREVFSDARFGSMLAEYYFPRTRHIVIEPDDQKRVVDIIRDWASAGLPSDAGRVTAVGS